MAKPTTEEDNKAIGSKLNEIGLMMLALHDIAETDGTSPDSIITAAIEFAKRSVHIIDACLEKLDAPLMGNWREEFEEEEEEPGEAEGVDHG